MLRISSCDIWSVKPKQCSRMYVPKQIPNCTKKSKEVPLKNPTFGETLAPYSTHTGSHAHTFEEFSQGEVAPEREMQRIVKKIDFKSEFCCRQKRPEREEWDRGKGRADTVWHDPDAFQFVDASSLLIAHSFARTHARKTLATESKIGFPSGNTT